MATLTMHYYSKVLNAVETVSAILPTDHLFAQPDRSYRQGPWRTIYLLHGFSGNHTQWLYESGIQQWAAQYGYAVIMPSGSNSFYLDNEDTQVNYGQFIGEELVEVTRKMFPLSQKREDTVIGGLSMGGYGAIRNGLRYPDTFGAILGLSSAMIVDEVSAMTPDWPGNHFAPYGYYRHTFGDPKALIGSDKDPRFLAKALADQNNKPLLFLACGSDDDLFDRSESFHTYLDSIHYPHAWWVKPGKHDFSFWNLSMPAGLEWLKQQQG